MLLGGCMGFEIGVMIFSGSNSLSYYFESENLPPSSPK
jgi:hypothetical protein